MTSTIDLPRPRVPITRTIAIAWLLLLTLVVCTDHLRSVRAKREESSGVSRAELTTLQQSLSSQAEAMEALKRQPVPVTQAHFLDTQEKLDARLIRLEQAIEGSALKADIGSLQEHMDAIEARVVQISKSSRRAASTPSNPPSTPQEALTPPFLILGAEMRGGERFLSLLPTGTQTIAGVHLLRPGESEGEWHLETLDTKTAVFHVRDRMERIELP